LFENYAGSLGGERRHRVGLRTRWIKRTGTGKAGHADFPLYFRVIRLEIGVGDRPVGEAGAGDRAELGALDEIDFVEPPEIRGEMDAGATDQATVNQRALRLGFFIGSFAEGVGLQLGVIGKQIFVQNFYFVMGEVGFGEIGHLFQDQDAKSILG
jgi:hypothetical protein